MVKPIQKWVFPNLVSFTVAHQAATSVLLLVLDMMGLDPPPPQSAILTEPKK